MRHRLRATRVRDDVGAAAVEFALIIIPLLMVIGGVVNFGVAFAQQLSLDNAIRQSARAGAVDTGANLTDVARNEFDQTALARDQAGAVTVTFPQRGTCENSAFGDSLEVRGEVTTRFLFPWVLPGSVAPREVTLDSSAEFQCEFS